MDSKRRYTRILDLFIVGVLYSMVAILLYRTPEEQLVNCIEIFLASQLALFWFFRIFSKRKISFNKEE
jgi:hypothetical protein